MPIQFYAILLLLAYLLAGLFVLALSVRRSGGTYNEIVEGVAKLQRKPAWVIGWFLPVAIVITWPVGIKMGLIKK